MTSALDDSWERLYRKARDCDIGLFVGAGVSSDNELPSWSSLTARLADVPEVDVGKLEAWGVPLTSQLEIAASGFAKHEDWVEVVREVLYSGFRMQLEQEGLSLEILEVMEASKEQLDAEEKRAFEESRGRVQPFFETTNPTLVELVSLSSSKKDGLPRVAAVLTTNLDSLLQICDRAIHGRRKLRTIERATKASETRKTSLYHLHGYLAPHPGTSPRGEAADRLVLTEKEYTRRNDSPSHWAATCLHFVLRECPVVFVGCSMKDELVRKALHRTRLDRITDAEAEGKKAEHSEPKHFAVREWPGDDRTLEVLTESYELLDLNPLWVESFDRQDDELPRRLRGLRQAWQPG